MQWEDSWAAWKQASCPAGPLERAAAEAPPGADTADLVAPAPKRRKLGSDAVFGVRVGTAELDRLWNLTEDNLSALGADDRGGFKTVRQLMEPVIEEMQEAAAGEDDGMLIRASRSKLYSWKALRAVARANLQAFAQAVQKGGDLEVAARVMYPADCPPPPEPPVPAAREEAGATAAGAPASTGVPPDTGAGSGAAQTAEDDAASGGDGDGTAAEAAGAAAAALAGEEEEGELPELEDGEAPASAAAGDPPGDAKSADAAGGSGGEPARAGVPVE